MVVKRIIKINTHKGNSAWHVVRTSKTIKGEKGRGVCVTRDSPIISSNSFKVGL